MAASLTKWLAISYILMLYCSVIKRAKPLNASCVESCAARAQISSKDSPGPIMLTRHQKLNAHANSAANGAKNKPQTFFGRAASFVSAVVCVCIALFLRTVFIFSAAQISHHNRLGESRRWGDADVSTMSIPFAWWLYREKLHHLDACTGHVNSQMRNAVHED